MSKGAKMVPLKEMVDAITVNKQAQAPIERGQWVRLKGGLYKDDLAKVESVDFAAGKAEVKVIPRLNWTEMAKARDNREEGAARRNPFGRQAVRPPPKPFNADDPTALGFMASQDRYDQRGVTIINSHR